MKHTNNKLFKAQTSQVHVQMKDLLSRLETHMSYSLAGRQSLINHFVIKLCYNMKEY